MTIEEMLRSRSQCLHYAQMFAMTEPHAAYPGKKSAPRVGILRRLEAIDERTRYTLDILAASLRSAPFFDTLEPEEFYMLRQRLLCALEVLERLEDSQPTPRWLSTSSEDLVLEDRWLLIGLWKQFGPFWLQNLAWRISRGQPE